MTHNCIFLNFNFIFDVRVSEIEMSLYQLHSVFGSLFGICDFSTNVVKESIVFSSDCILCFILDSMNPSFSKLIISQFAFFLSLNLFINFIFFQIYIIYIYCSYHHRVIFNLSFKQIDIWLLRFV
jgi:hypothetical protein